MQLSAPLGLGLVDAEHGEAHDEDQDRSAWEGGRSVLVSVLTWRFSPENSNSRDEVERALPDFLVSGEEIIDLSEPHSKERSATGRRGARVSGDGGGMPSDKIRKSTHIARATKRPVIEPAKTKMRIFLTKAWVSAWLPRAKSSLSEV